MNIIGSGINPLKNNPLKAPTDHYDLGRMKEASSMMRVKEDEIIICSKCGCELFISPIRLAKSKITPTKSAVGLITESPRAFCFKCHTELPHTSDGIVTKGDRIEKETPVETSNQEGGSNV